MFFRILYLIALIGVVGRDSGGASRVEVVGPGGTGGPDEERRMGGEGFGNIVLLVALLGVAILAAIVILAVLALSGQFANELIDPPV